MTDRSKFYIGYLPEMPRSIARFVKPVVLGILCLLLLIAMGIALTQKEFAKGVYEFGALTEVSGQLLTEPYPHLITGHEGAQKTILLVGFGKCGAESAIEGYENTHQQILEGREVTVRGTLIYNHEQTVLELTEGEQSIVAVGQAATIRQRNSQGEHVVMAGEIIDPKCFFGVMKPGEGKTHKACAIRCISGGIPPVLKVNASDGRTRYYVLTGTGTTSINQSILPFVGQNVMVSGLAFSSGDWASIQVTIDQIQRIR